MATYSSSLRAGLPRVEGGDPWPPEGVIGEPVEPGTSPGPEEVVEADESVEPVESVDTAESAEPAEAVDSPEAAVDEQPVDAEPSAEPAGAAAGTAAAASDADAGATSEVPLRRGLPRVEGGEPWPPEGLAPAGAKAPSSPASAAAPAAAATAGAGVVVGTAAVADSDAPAEPAAEASVEAESAAEPAASEPAAAASPAESAPAGDVPLRRGLPRVAGGDPWPPEGLAPAGAKAASASSTSSSAPATSGSTTETAAGSSPTAAEEAPSAGEASSDTEESSSAPAAAAAGAVGAAAGAGAASAATGKKSSGELSDTPLRRGLPRVAGGDPWPPEGFAPASAEAAPTSTGADTAGSTDADTAGPADADTAASSSAEKPAADKPAPTDSSSAAPAAAAGAGAAAVGAGAAAATSSSDQKPAATSAEEKPARSGLPKSTGPAQRKPMSKPAAKATDKPSAKPAAKPAEKPAAKTSAAPAKSTAASGSATAKTAPAKKEPTMIGSKSVGQWAKLGGLGLGGLIVVAGILVLAARGLTTLPGVPEFLERYPGEYHLPEFVDDGFPGWARWTHFLNVFFMVLIIRSGLQVRHQQKPPAFYTPKKGGKKISINLWFHTGIDLLWLANGVIFVVLLFISGHWARIVPTSWEVFPNAVSAMLQYAMLDWPAEDGWINYNSLQQLMYFIVVFIAAPLAAITGVRMSEWWPKNATKLNKFYPAPLARAIHFPTMIFFVVFIIIHVFLVLATGMRQNLNHMYWGSDDLNWVGFIWFVVSLAVIAGGWFAARPMLLAPIANMFGRVSSR